MTGGMIAVGSLMSAFRLALVAVVLLVSPHLAVMARESGTPGPGELGLEAALLGDTRQGVAARLTFEYPGLVSGDFRGIPYLTGSVIQDDRLVGSFRVGLRPGEEHGLTTVTVIPLGEVVIEARLMLESEGGLPHMIGKVARTLSVEPVGVDYVAENETDPEAILAEGFAPVSAGAVRLQAPRRDLAPNLFIVEASVEDPVARVEFWVDGKKIRTRNAPPYRAELDLGSLPRGVEVRVVGYDRRGRYVDADAWVVNERETPLEVRITRTAGEDDRVYIKVSVQGRRGVERAELWADDRRLAEWRKPPFAIGLDADVLRDVEYLRASAYAPDGFEATDILYLRGDRYFERVEVNLIEFPVTVLDGSGKPVVGLTRDDLVVRENGEPVELAQFAFSSDLPLAVGVLVDQSGSMRERMDDAKTAAVGFLQSVMRKGDRGFIGGFSWSTQKLSPLVSDTASLRIQVDEMAEAEGATALYDAIVTGLYRFRNVEGRKALVIVTDGDDTASRISQEEMVRYVRASRVPLYFIGIGMSRLDFMASSRLRNLATETGGVAFFIGGVDELPAAYASIETELRTQYQLGYYTESVGKDETYRAVEVTVPGRDVTIRSIRGYIP